LPQFRAGTTKPILEYLAIKSISSFEPKYYRLKVESPLFIALILAMAAVIVRSIIGLLEEWCREQHQSDGRSRIYKIQNAQNPNLYAGKNLWLNFMPF